MQKFIKNGALLCYLPPWDKAELASAAAGLVDHKERFNLDEAFHKYGGSILWAIANRHRRPWVWIDAAIQSLTVDAIRGVISEVASVNDVSPLVSPLCHDEQPFKS